MGRVVLETSARWANRVDSLLAVTDDLSFALRLADAADAVTADRFGALDLHVDTKPDLTPVSDADRAAEAIAEELSKLGLKIFASKEHANNHTSNKRYSSFKKNGIDAVIIIKEIIASDGRPESASLLVINTVNGKQILKLTWQNGWGGPPGSPSDRIMRSNSFEAAKDIAHKIYYKIRDLEKNNA